MQIIPSVNHPVALFGSWKGRSRHPTHFEFKRGQYRSPTRRPHSRRKPNQRHHSFDLPVPWTQSQCISWLWKTSPDDQSSTALGKMVAFFYRGAGMRLKSKQDSAPFPENFLAHACKRKSIPMHFWFRDATANSDDKIPTTIQSIPMESRHDPNHVYGIPTRLTSIPIKSR